MRFDRTGSLLTVWVLVSLACSPNVGDVVHSSISGTVVAGAVNGALVTAYTVNALGRRGTKLATTTTRPDGAFTIDVGGQFGATLVCASRGTYAEEATAGLVDLGSNELCALVDDVKLGQPTTGVMITPFTTLHTALTACLRQSEREVDVPAASKRAGLRINDLVSQGTPGFDFRTTSVFDTTAGVAPSFTPDVWHGVLLAGLSESARQISLASNIDPGVRVTSATLTTELARDVDDGRCVFDGRGPGDVKLEQGNVALSSNSLRGAPQGLALSIEGFLRGEHNKSGVTVDSVKDLVDGIASFKSDIFDDSATAPPTVAFTAPNPGSVAGKPAIVVAARDDVGIEDLSFTAPQLLVGTGTKTCESTTHCELHGVLNTGLFPSGPLLLTARATNVAGVSSDASVTVTVSNALPDIEVASPSAGTVQGTVELKATASSAAGISAFDVTVPGATFLPACSPPAVTTNCDRELDPNVIDILWDTTGSTEGPDTITFAATDTGGNTSFAPVDVVVDNIPAGTVAGVVELGFPVVGAQVTVFQTTDGSRGPQIGSAVTDDKGKYQIVNQDYVGPIEVIATGGSYVDASTGLSLSLRVGQELTAALSNVAGGEAAVVNVNALTTLALSRALSRLADSPSFSSAVDFNANLFSSHLLRPGSLSLTGSVSADLLTDTPAPSDSSAILALAHAGLSRLAAQASINAGGAPGQVTPTDVLGVLEQDLSDGVLDGTNNGAALFLDGQSVPMDSYTLRTTLADRIDAFVKNAPLLQNGVAVLSGTRNAASTITSAALSGPGLLYDDLAEDRSVLFPADVPVHPFDHTAPSITLSFGAPNASAKNGDTLIGTVSITGTASDTSGVASYEVVSPPTLTDEFSSVEDLRVEIDGTVAPNRADVNQECNIDIASPPLSLPDPDRQVCLCVEASDSVANTADDALCFTRPRPVVTTDVSSFIGPAIAAINVHAEGSFNLTQCTATLTSSGSNNVVDAGAPGNDATCDVHVPFNASLPSGTANLAVSVTEIGGAVTTTSIPFTVDTVPPQLSITAPAAGAFVATPPRVSVNVSDANLRTVTLDVTTSSTQIVAGAPGVVGPTGVVVFDPFLDLQPDGLRTIKVTATDAAGNVTVASRSYTKDTTAPALAALTAADGNPLGFFQLTATTAFTASSQCSQFPFTGCVFNIASGTTTQSVPLRISSSTVDTYRRWQHLAGTATNPSTIANPPAENRAPTLRLKTDPGAIVEARVDATCATSTSFHNRSVASFTADNLGLVDIPIVDANNLTASTLLLANQTGATTLCLSARATDQAGNVGGIVNHFFKYEATPAPLFMVFNAGPYDPASFVDDVGSLDHGHDDDALSGNGQGTAGRVFAHAYLVSPSTTTSYAYKYGLSSGAAPSINVTHAETVQISKTRAFNWCFTHEAGGNTAVDHDDELANPDYLPAQQVGAPPNEPFWYGSSFLGERKFGPSWTLWTPTSASLLQANSVIEHNPHPSTEPDSTFEFGPEFSYSTSTNTTKVGQPGTFVVPLPTVNLDVWAINTVNGEPDNLLASGSNVSFTAGGSSASSRSRLLFFRAPVPQSALTLKSASVLNGENPTQGFNSSCDARKDSSSPIAGQMFTLNADHWVVANTAIPNSNVKPAPAKPLLWVVGGQFPYCDGTSSHDCRYGRYFDDYVDAQWTWASGRSLTPSGQISGVSGAAFKTQTAHTIPAVTTRTLSQEP